MLCLKFLHVGVREDILSTDILVLLKFGAEKACLHDSFSINESTKLSVVLVSYSFSLTSQCLSTRSVCLPKLQYKPLADIEKH